ncbi:major facilitator superfamily domain-containing protein [Schizophyllum amplum]|uniref:Major facilitator superfamily domain-containing protein n=1 Tax=Schizophyllum amplum TaxID=97359 RepID=A0A550CM46_9AGAR|nr:major facilitator superfamily domain-containing protein [Auriculariopsis ampla]
MATVLSYAHEKQEDVAVTSTSVSDEDAKVAVSAPLPLGTPIEQNPGVWRRLRKPALDLDSVATQPSVFDDPAGLEVYRPPPQYENAHRFDPDARWTWREEKRIIRKIDIKIMIWAAIMFFSLDLDRSNLTQANTDNFLDDLNLTTDDFNMGNTVFRLAFMCAEIPSQLLSKRIGPDIWIPSQISLWSIVALSQFWLKGRTSFLATRALLGILQGGFIPDAVLYLSYFYTKYELPIRLAAFWISNYVSHVVRKAGWRWLFLIEGIITLAVGLFSFVMMPAGPTQTRKWYRPKGWFTEREEVIMVNRVLRDDPSKCDMHNREGLSPRMLLSALSDWRLYPIYALGIVHMIPTGPPQTYLTLSLRNLGFSTTESTLLTIPSTVIGGILLIATAVMSELVNSRVAATITLQIWSLPLLVALYTFNSDTSQWVYFAVVTLIAGFPYVHPIQVAWTSRNSYSVKTRTVSASVYNVFVQAGAIIYNNIYREDDKLPSDIDVDKRGNRDLIAINCMNLVIYIGVHFFYKVLNNRRDKIWNSWTLEQRQQYLETTKDTGNKRMDFRFAY